ncbi:MAG: site-2 protease family protein [Clostridiales bacterium]|nr:site-2 protease family protein [Clostridiales bacterium]
MLINLLLGDGDIMSKVIYFFLYLIAIVVSLSFHEWAHAHAAHRMGDDTALNMGRMTLNPMAHIDPVGFLMLIIVGFGWAKPVPVNPRNYKNYRKGEFIVSFAGIFTNLIIALVSAFLYVFLAKYEKMSGNTLPDMLFTFLVMLGYLNCGLAIFNFIPVYPLDGSHIFTLVFGKLLGAKAVYWLQKNGRYILYGFIALSFILSRMGISIIGGAVEWLFGLFIKLFSAAANLIG